MVAFEEFSIMAPGTSGMLRARRKDINVKPNRFLDKTASRGMLYENEELRLRTININADVEKGQQYIKRLRKENIQLRREIWNLRDQNDKLSAKIKEQQEYDDEESVEDAQEFTNSESENARDNKSNTLSVVQEESEENSILGSAGGLCTEELLNFSDNDANLLIQCCKNECGNYCAISTDLCDKIIVNVGSILCNNCMDNTFNKQTPVLSSDVFQNVHSDTNCVNFSRKLFENLKVEEVIDELENQLKEKCSLNEGIKGVRLSEDHCFITLNDEQYVKILTDSGLKIKGAEIQFDEILPDYKTTVQISSLPHSFPDERIVAALSVLGITKGSVKRNSYKGVDVGDRTIEIVPSKIIPSLKRENISRRKSFRSQLNINLKDPDEGKGVADIVANTGSAKNDISIEPKIIETTNYSSSFFSKNTGILLTPATPNTTSEQNNVFNFPNSASPQIIENQQTQNPLQKSATDSRKTSQRRRGSNNNKNSEQHAAAVQLNRKLSVNFKNTRNGEISNLRRPSMDYGNYYERSSSDVSSSKTSICKRKLSATGHEGSGKIPWCGCWGIGCC